MLLEFVIVWLEFYLYSVVLLVYCFAVWVIYDICCIGWVLGLYLSV